MPLPPSRSGATPLAKGILELDRFTESSVQKWTEISQDLDELNDVLHFHLEPERRRHRSALIASLQSTLPQVYTLDNWVRIVDFQWALHALSAAGSLTSIGGRFNAGRDLNRNTIEPWPALYIAENHTTAYREKFQLVPGQTVDGLTAEELALATGRSHLTVVLRGNLTRVFEINSQSLSDIARILGRIKMPSRAEQLKRKLKIKPASLRMLSTGKQLFETAVVQNWRALPVQFGLPAPSHILAELIRAAGFEAIAYQSMKGGGKCIAIFLDNLDVASYVEIVDTPPLGNVITRLDCSSSDILAGWAQVGMTPPIR